jgi:hypothetical protein
MKLALKILSIFVLSACMSTSCTEENESSAERNSRLLLGHWNDYENGTEETGFTPGVTTSLTLIYESGIAFSSDGTFRSRYHNNGTWTESNVDIGTYEVGDHTISLLFRPGTKDEFKLDVQIIKLDQKYLWIKHSHFVEQEYHLEKVN